MSNYKASDRPGADSVQGGNAAGADQVPQNSPSPAGQEEKEREAGDKFKAFVHSYLTEHGVPEGDPTNQHQIEGCRIGARLDLLFAQLAGLKALLSEHGVNPDAGRVSSENDCCPDCGVASGYHHKKGCPGIGGIVIMPPSSPTSPAVQEKSSENWTGIPDSEVCHCGELISKHDQLQGCNNPRPLSAAPASPPPSEDKKILE